MLLSLYSHHYYQYDPSFSPKSSPFPKTLPFQNPNPSKPHLSITSSSSTNSETLTLTKTAIKRITEKLRTLGYFEESKQTETPKTGHGSAGEIFLPSTRELPKHRVGHTIDTSWSTPDRPIPKPGTGVAIRRFHQLRRKVKKQKNGSTEEETAVAETPPPSVAEMTIQAEELRRLRSVGIRLNKRLKVGKAGITEGIVNGIHERWRRSELVKIKCEDLCRLNMKRTHETLERKTGGLVVWRSGSIIILYRGANYKYPYFYSNNNTEDAILHDKVSLGSGVDHKVYDEQEANAVGTNSSAEPISSNTLARPSLVYGVGSPKKLRFQLPGEAQLEEESDRLLDGLGPRFIDWWGYDPLPVDADLLPGIVPGYRRPFRLLPYGVKPKLTDQEMTTLRRLGRPLPCHFALGRNRNLQGLAASMVKLWEKCEIAKIAVKRGVQNTNSEIMVDELKWLTGGSLLSRDREFIVFYRGKDFLPPAVSTAIEERRKYTICRERPRLDQSSSDDTMPKLEAAAVEPASVDKLQEANDQKRDLSTEQRKLTSMNSAVKSMDIKLSLTLEKKAKAEKLLAELEKAAELKKPEMDKEGISQEERYMLRKVGLRMKPFLLLGRRGVFDGTIENMHLHWKYRELVKIISKDRSIEDVHSAARTLEAESGGILVAVERVSKGHAIIIYRGKNYQRPADLRPQTLLNKREAMNRSLEAQRRESLKLHVLNLTRNIDQLKFKLVKEDTKTNCRQSTEYRRSDTDSETSDQSGPVESAYHQEDVEAREWHEADASSLHSIESLRAFSDNEETASTSLGINCTFHVDDMKDKLMDSFSGDEGELVETELESSSEADLTKTYSNIFPDEIGYIPECLDASSEGAETIGTSFDVIESTFHLDDMKDKSDSFSKDEDEFVETELEPSSDPDLPETYSNIFPCEMGHRFDLESPPRPENLLQQSVVLCSDTDDGAYVSDKDLSESAFEMARNELDSYVHKDQIGEGSNVEIPFRPAPLSNRDRLVLRKQALRMKKRPVLSIGRNNVITGVAKAIKNHFRRNPLAIVNVKGRAKGTSVQEVVFKLEQETGAVLVSREPSKVILYRGWGEGEEPNGAKEKKDTTKPSTSRNGTAGEVISPKLIAAVRLECGLPISQEEEDTS